MSKTPLMALAGKIQFPHFNYEPHPICGVGEDHAPIVNMDRYIDTSKNLELHLEICRGMALAKDQKVATYPGAVHRSESEKGKKSFTEILCNLEKYDPTGVHRQMIERLANESGNSSTYYVDHPSIYRYMYYAMDADIAWYHTYYLRRQGFGQKTKADGAAWTDEALMFFPSVVEYIKTLPFKEIGRVLIFSTFPRTGITAHRDYHITPHKDHMLNLYLGQGYRPSFIWDDINNKKVYLEEGATSYCFNNRDYHGVDPEPGYRYTLRVDGTFEDWLQKELKLKDGWVWNDQIF
jgi:hypothetical protein